MDTGRPAAAPIGHLRVRCGTCGAKWFYEPHHLQRDDIDPARCERCGGATEPLEDPAARSP